MVVVSKHSKLSLYPFRVSRDKKNFIVEDLSSGEFYEMPEICIDAITMMNEDNSLLQVEAVLREKYPSEHIDVEGFTADLLNMGLVKSLDGNSISRKLEYDGKNDGLNWISPKVGRFFFNRYSSILYSLCILISTSLFILHPEVFPVYSDVFLFDLMIYNILIFLSISFLLVLVHEIGHVLAVRAAGLPTKIELGHRLFFVVLETDMTRVWSLQPEKRYRLYLAGMYFDAIVMFLALIAQLIFAEYSYVVGISKVVVVSTFIRIIYQFCVYMKTDLYYVLENYSGCYNLMENGQSFLKSWIPYYKKTDNKITRFKGEEKLVRPYAIFYLFGVMVTVAITAFYNVPLIVHAGLLVMPGFLEPATSILFWDAVVFFFQFILMFGLLAYSYTKKYRENQQRQPL